eukprot:6182486-Pleurochrysis_carterae.AAC.1
MYKLLISHVAEAGVSFDPSQHAQDKSTRASQEVDIAKTDSSAAALYLTDVGLPALSSDLAQTYAAFPKLFHFSASTAACCLLQLTIPRLLCPACYPQLAAPCTSSTALQRAVQSLFQGRVS